MKVIQIIITKKKKKKKQLIIKSGMSIINKCKNTIFDKKKVLNKKKKKVINKNTRNIEEDSKTTKTTTTPTTLEITTIKSTKNNNDTSKDNENRQRNSPRTRRSTNQKQKQKKNKNTDKNKKYKLRKNKKDGTKTLNHKKTIPDYKTEIIQINLDKPKYIPKRTQMVISVPLQLKDEMLCESSEISNGVFLANSILPNKSLKVYVSLINTKNKPFKIKYLKLKLTPLNEFSIKEIENHKSLSNRQTENKNDNTNVINLQMNNIGRKLTQRNEIRLLERLRQIDKELKLDENLSMGEIESISSICYQYNDIFRLKNDPFTYTSAITHEIPLIQDQAPVNQKMYRLPKAQRQIINDQLREMLDNEIVQPSKSPWNSPLLVVPKNAGPNGEKKWQVVVDFRKLNEKTIGDAFPLPRIEDILDQLGHSRYFTTLDLASGYHQVLVDPKDRAKTAL